jgi:hypothetical protein
MLAAGLVSVAVLTSSTHFNDPDLWFHLKLGQIVWNTHTIPRADTFSHTVYGHPWTAHEWLAELSIYLAYRLGSEVGLMLWLCIFAALVLVLVYILCLRIGGNALAAFLCALSAFFFSTVGFAIRPHLIGYSFLAAEMVILENSSRNWRWLWFLPPLFALWVNCHGSFFFGAGVLVVYYACSYVNGKWGLLAAESWTKETRRRYLVILILCGCALFFNPIGISLLAYPLNVAFHQSTSMNAIEEWFPTDISSLHGFAMIALVLGILISSLARRSELRLRDLVLLAMGLILAIKHVRMLFVFGIMASPLLCRAIAPVLGNDSQKEHRIPNGILLATFVIVILGTFPSAAGIRQQVVEGTPVEAVDYIRRTGIKGPMLNEYGFGGYLIWAMPEEKVFIDGRGDVFDWAGVLKAYGRWATLSEDPNLLLDKYKIRFCLIRSNSAIAQVLPYLPAWKKVYSDQLATIFVRVSERL